MVPWTHPSPYPKQHRDRSIHFCRAHGYCTASAISKVKYTDIAVRSLTCHTTTGTHTPYRITQCYLPPDRGDIPAFTLYSSVIYINCWCPHLFTRSSEWCEQVMNDDSVSQRLACAVNWLWTINTPAVSYINCWSSGVSICSHRRWSSAIKMRSHRASLLGELSCIRPCMRRRICSRYCCRCALHTDTAH